MAEPEFEELEQLKKELSGKKDEHISSEQLYAAVKGLSLQIGQLTQVFKMALGQMSAEDESQKRITEQLDILIKNDQDLARGLLLVLEIEKEQRDANPDRFMPARRNLSRRRASQRVGIRPDMSMPPSPPNPPMPNETQGDNDIEFPSSAQPNTAPR